MPHTVSNSGSPSSLDNVTTPGPATRLKELDKKSKELVNQKIPALVKQQKKLQNDKETLNKEKSKLDEKKDKIENNLKETKKKMDDEQTTEKEKKGLEEEYNKKMGKLADNEQKSKPIEDKLVLVERQLEEVAENIVQHRNEVFCINQQKDECNREIIGHTPDEEKDSSIASTSASIEEEPLIFNPSILQENYVENDILSREYAEQSLNQEVYSNAGAMLIGTEGKPGNNPLNDLALQQTIEASLRQRKSNDNSPSTNQYKPLDSKAGGQHPDAAGNHNVPQENLGEVTSWTFKGVVGTACITGSTLIGYSVYSIYNYFTSPVEEKTNTDPLPQTSEESSASPAEEKTNTDPLPQTSEESSASPTEENSVLESVLMNGEIPNVVHQHI